RPGIANWASRCKIDVDGHRCAAFAGGARQPPQGCQSPESRSPSSPAPTTGRTRLAIGKNETEPPAKEDYMKTIGESQKSGTDPRRDDAIEAKFHSGPPAIYTLTIAGVLWASVEWSPSRRRWCIEDGIGRCLAHVEHIHGEDVDAAAAVRLAVAMIRDGRMPTPEEAHEALQRRQPQLFTQGLFSVADNLVRMALDMRDRHVLIPNSDKRGR